MTGCVKRRSTLTTTVLSCLSLMTTPCNTRFGIPDLLSLRCGGLLPRQRAHAGDVLADLAHARGVLELSGGALEAQVELLFLQRQELVLELVRRHRLEGREPLRRFHELPSLLGNALDEARLDRQLRGAEAQRLAGDVLGDAVDLEHDAAGRDACRPELGRALALAHAHLGRLLRHRHVREYPDPDPALALHLARDRAPRRLDLARGHPLRFKRLEAELAEIELRAALRGTADAALEGFAELGLLGLQHGEPLNPSRSLSCLLAVAAAARAASLVGQALVLRHWVVLEDLALEDPDLDAAGAVGRERRRGAVVYVGAQRVQRDAALAVPLHPRDLGAAEAARAIDADALGAKPHRRLHGALLGAAEGDPALELLGDRLGDERRVDLGLAHLDDVDRHVGVGHLADELAQLLDVGALLADDDAGPRRVDRDAALLVRALDDDLRHCRLLQLLHQRFADGDVLVHQPRVFALAGKPARIPRPVDAEPKTDRVDFLTHQITSRLFGGDFPNHDGEVRERFQDPGAAAAGSGMETLQHQGLADEGLLDDEVVDVEVVVVFGVGDGALEALAHLARDALLRELEIGKRRRALLAPDELRDEIQLLRRDAQHARHGLGLALRQRPGCCGLAHLTSSSPSCPTSGRGRCGSARTRRTCGRPSPRSRRRGCASDRCRRRR